MRLSANLLGLSIAKKPEGGFDLTCISPTGDGIRIELSEIPDLHGFHISKSTDGLEFTLDA